MQGVSVRVPTQDVSLLDIQITDGFNIMTQEDHIKLLAWYDNEWGYANRVIDLVSYISRAESTQLKEEAICLTQTM